MAIVPTEELRNYFSEVSGSDLDILDIIHTTTEKAIKTYCKREFESTSYSLEEYSGRGHRTINLNNYPIIYLDRVAINTVDAIRIKNTNEGTSAGVSVNSTGLRLVYNDTADSSVTFATYTTVSDVIDAVNSLGSGWSAESMSSTYNSFKSSDILEMYGKSAIDSNYVYLRIPDEGIYDFDVDPENGQIIRHGGWPKGTRNVFVDYTAGYSAGDMPEDLKGAVKYLVHYFYERKESDSFGISSLKAGQITNEFERGSFPKEIKQILYQYRRFRV